VNVIARVIWRIATVCAIGKKRMAEKRQDMPIGKNKNIVKRLRCGIAVMLRSEATMRRMEIPPI
jgi:hypothetical protein